MQGLTAVSGFLDTQRPAVVAVALSGGPDSWALALLTHDWCSKNNAACVALTVDHQLRTGSTAEAQAVAATCAHRGITHHILTWQHDPIASSLQEQARTARYALLTDWCRANNVNLLLTAHHADDQAETVLLRFAKSSDVGGLGGLRTSSSMNGVTVARPLLAATKQQLIDYATTQGVPFATDSSNNNPRFARARLRDARAVLEAEGLTTSNITRLADKMRAADEALDFATHHMIGAYFKIGTDGSISALRSVFHDKPAAITQRALLSLWRLATGDAGHPLGHDQLQRLHQFVGGADSKITLGGMVLEQNADTLLACRELAACTATQTIAPGSRGVWDNRFAIHNPTSQPVTVQALGTFGRDRIDTLGDAYAWLHAVPPAARATLPAAAGLPFLLAKPVSVACWAEFLPAKSTETALYSA